MTHEELLSAINSKNYRKSRTIETPYFALRAVVELHTFVQNKRGKSGLSLRCTECGFAYPCPTIQAIEKELA